MSATILPFRKRQPAGTMFAPGSVEFIVANFAHRMGMYGPEDYKPGGAAWKAGLRPLPEKAELVERVLQRAKDKRNSRQPR